jgi:CRP-like cAMP-binding protein
MALPQAALSGNMLLRTLLPYDRDGRVTRSSRRRNFSALTTVLSGEERAPEVLFPIDGVFSLILANSDGSSVDVGSIGSEGAAGLRWLYSDAPMPDLTIRCTIAGSAFAIPYKLFESFVLGSERVRRIVDRYYRARNDAMLQLCACSATHPILQRAARLILDLSRSADRADLAITHETLAAMLGTRRASITVALSALTAAGALSTMRASLVVGDRSILERNACSCHAAIARIYAHAVSNVVPDAAAATLAYDRVLRYG